MNEEPEINVPPNTWRGNVAKEWCDYNGHLNLAYYVVMFDFATDAFYDSIDQGETYVLTMNQSWFTAESHVCYLSEVFASTEVYCTTQLIGFDDKRMHYFHRMFRATDHVMVATNELLALHVDLNGRKVTKVPPTNLVQISQTFDTHRALPKPTQLGRTISILTPIQARR